MSFAMVKNHADKNFEAPTTCSSEVSETEQRVVPCNKRKHFELTEDQLSKLKKRFTISQYIKGKEKELMAKDLGIPQTSVLSWFRHQRNLKRLQLANKAT